MESLLPSEIARLVYGYLIEENCEASAQLFLETSACLKECLILQKKGRKFITSVLGLSLVDILNLYTDAVCLVKNYSERKDTLNETLSDFVKELGNILALDRESSRNIAKTVFLRISVPNKRSIRSRTEDVENNEEDEEETEKEDQNKQKKNIENKEANLAKNNSNTNADDFDLNMLQTLLDNTALHERLAENINKAIDSGGEISNHKTDEKKFIETILNNTEADPIFHELLDELVGPRAEDTTTPEDTDKENGDPSEDRQTAGSVIGQTTSEDVETRKKIEEESTLAVECILAENKKIQQEKVPDETSQVTETVSNSIPQVDGTLGGLYKQSFIIPAGYTVTDMIPAAQLQAFSTPLEPLKISNVATFGHLSPILSQQAIASKPCASVRNSLQLSRIILPKREGFVIQIPAQDNSLQDVRVELPPLPKRLPEVIKRSRVRTRGGIQKVGTRGVKAISPQTLSSVNGKINVLVSRKLKKTNTSGIKTRAMLKKQEKKQIDPDPIILSDSEDDLQQSNEEPKQKEDPKEKDSVPIEEKQKENHNKEESEGTPEQQSVITKSRISFSTPRRNHVRALDFATPVKELVLRKSATSPKIYNLNRKGTSSLEIIKRGIFKSPLKEIPKEDEKKDESNNKKSVNENNDNSNNKKSINEKNDESNNKNISNEKNVESNNKNIKENWDADLRKFMVAGEGMDIPTSVGLKRKTGAKRERITNGRKKGPRRKLPKKFPEEKKFNEELVDQIEKEVRGVIGEEEMVLNTSETSELGSLIEQKLAEEVNSLPSLEKSGDERALGEASNRSTTPDVNITQKEVTEIPSKSDDKNSEPQENEQEGYMNNEGNEQESCTNNEGNEKEGHSEIVGTFNTSTPLKLVMSPVNENSRGQLTPTTKILMSHLGKVSTRFSSVFSPTSQTSLENILIKECSRMETEKAVNHLGNDIKKLDSPKSDSASCNQNPLEGKEPNSNNSNSNQPNTVSKELTFESVCKSNVNIFQTPAKFFSACTLPGTPVDMTPVTKVLTSEASFSATVLVTPTLPPTPKNLSQSETPQKTDVNSISSMNNTGNEPSKLPEKVSVSRSSIASEENTDKDNVDESNRETNISESSFVDSIKCAPKDVEKIKDHEAPTKTLCKTPKIKLMSPKTSQLKFNESLCKKRKGKLKEQCGNKNNNLSKKILEIAPPQPNLGDSLHDEIEGEQILDNSNHSEQSNTNKNPERMLRKKTNIKHGQIETKGQSPLRRSKRPSCTDGSKKSPRQNSSKPVSELMVDEMEMEIRHLLKDAKAKLFGPDNSSDSDSEAFVKVPSGMNGRNVQLNTARERLQKLENIRMLDSSSSSDESCGNEKQVAKHKGIEKDSHSKDKIHVENKAADNPEHFSVESNMENNMKKEDDCGIRKSDGCCSVKLPDNPKTVVSKEIEESCESFPTLHLSEESNQSLRSDNQLIKNPKPKKSPLGGNDFLGKKNSSLLLVTSPLKLNEQAGGSGIRNIRSNQTKTTNYITCETGANPGIIAKPSIGQDSDINEKIFHFNEEINTSKSKLSDSAEKDYQTRSCAVSKYLDNYDYSFVLNVDKSGHFVTKELRTSAFLNIFDLSKSLHSKRESSSIDHRTPVRSKSKNRKRNRSASSSEDEKQKRDRGRAYSSLKGGRGWYRTHRLRDSFDRRDLFSRHKYSTRSYASRYRDFGHLSDYNRKRSRRESPDSRRISKREDRRPLEEKCHSSKYDTRFHSRDKRYNDRFSDFKSASEGDRKHADISSSYTSDRTIESNKDRCSSSSQRLTIDVDDQSVSHRTPKQPSSTEREDGELSDSSEIKMVSPEVNRSIAHSLGAHDSRATLLRKVDLDHFLSIVHGEE